MSILLKLIICKNIMINHFLFPFSVYIDYIILDISWGLDTNPESSDCWLSFLLSLVASYSLSRGITAFILQAIFTSGVTPLFYLSFFFYYSFLFFSFPSVFSLFCSGLYFPILFSLDYEMILMAHSSLSFFFFFFEK